MRRKTDFGGSVPDISNLMASGDVKWAHGPVNVELGIKIWKSVMRMDSM